MSTAVRTPIRAHRRSAAIAPSAAVALLITMTLTASGATSMAMTDEPRPPHCHEFVRFGERWELCTSSDGLVSHRLGISTPRT
jgi:hypothetical protein